MEEGLSVGLRKIVQSVMMTQKGDWALPILNSREMNSGRELGIFLKKLLNQTDTPSVEKMEDI